MSPSPCPCLTHCNLHSTKLIKFNLPRKKQVAALHTNLTLPRSINWSEISEQATDLSLLQEERLIEKKVLDFSIRSNNTNSVENCVITCSTESSVNKRSTKWNYTFISHKIFQRLFMQQLMSNQKIARNYRNTPKKNKEKETRAHKQGLRVCKSTPNKEKRKHVCNKKETTGWA